MRKTWRVKRPFLFLPEKARPFRALRRLFYSFARSLRTLPTRGVFDAGTPIAGPVLLMAGLVNTPTSPLHLASACADGACAAYTKHPPPPPPPALKAAWRQRTSVGRGLRETRVAVHRLAVTTCHAGPGRRDQDADQLRRQASSCSRDAKKEGQGLPFFACCCGYRPRVGDGPRARDMLIRLQASGGTACRGSR